MSKVSVKLEVKPTNNNVNNKGITKISKSLTSTVFNLDGWFF